MTQIKDIEDLASLTDPLAQRVQGIGEMTADEQRTLLRDTEQAIKAVRGEADELWGRSYTDEGERRLIYLLELRRLILNEMAIPPTPGEIKGIETLNNKLQKMMAEGKARCQKMRKLVDKDIGLEIKTGHIMVRSHLEYNYDSDKPALKLANDDYYGSDFDYMLNLTSDVTERSSHYMHDFSTGSPTDGKARPQCASGPLANEAYSHIGICFALNALCNHLPYSIPDVLRMDGIELVTKVSYAQTYYDPNTEMKKYYDEKRNKNVDSQD